MSPNNSHDEIVYDLAHALGVNKSDALQFVEYYNNSFDDYGNEVYEEVETRIAHWANFVSGGWFSRRLDYPLIRSSAMNLVIDVGFSVPYAYSFARGRPQDGYLFIDKEDSAIEASRAIGHLIGVPEHVYRDELVNADVEDGSAAKVIMNRLEGVSGSVLLVASELIEHLDDATTFWSLVQKADLSVSAEGQLEVYVTLPIGSDIPSHNLVFASYAEASAYVGTRMDVKDEWYVCPAGEYRMEDYLAGCYCAVGRWNDD